MPFVSGSRNCIAVHVYSLYRVHDIDNYDTKRRQIYTCSSDVCHPAENHRTSYLHVIHVIENYTDLVRLV